MSDFSPEESMKSQARIDGGSGVGGGSFERGGGISDIPIRWNEGLEVYRSREMIHKYQISLGRLAQFSPLPN